MKTPLLFSLVVLCFQLQAQTIYDFSSNPLTNGWTYYDDYGSVPSTGFEYNTNDARIDYHLTTGFDVCILHTQLAATLTKDYCVTFQITTTNLNNDNTWFPLALTPYELTGTDLHPWRKNAINQVAGAMQNIDFLAVEVNDNELRFFNRDNDILTGTSIQSMTPPFMLQTNTTYWVKLEISNTTTATLSVYQDAGFNTQLGSSTFTIPVLDDMNHLYIANGNGNNTTNQYGYLDDYRIDICSGLGLENVLPHSSDKEIVKIVDALGRETSDKSNTTLIYIYSDGTTKKVHRME